MPLVILIVLCVILFMVPIMVVLTESNNSNKFNYKTFYFFFMWLGVIALVTWGHIAHKQQKYHQTVKVYPIHEELINGNIVQCSFIDDHNIINIQSVLNCVSNSKTQNLEITHYEISCGLDMLKSDTYKLVPKTELDK